MKILKYIFLLLLLLSVAFVVFVATQPSEYSISRSQEIKISKDIVFVEIETVGEELDHGEVFGTVEAVKTVSDLFMPLSGTVKEKNEELDTAAELVNSDPYGKGWMIRIELSNPSEIDELLDAEGYKKLL